MESISLFLNNVSTYGTWSARVGPLGRQKSVRVSLVGDFVPDELIGFRTSIIQETQVGLKYRFPDADLLTAFRIFDPQSYLHLKRENLHEAGRAEMGQILKHLAQGSQLTDMTDRGLLPEYQQQFVKVKSLLFQRARMPAAQRSMLITWADFHFQKLDQTLPLIFKLVMIGLVIPLNTACVERGFSLHCNVKNRLSNRLKVAQVDGMIKVRQLSPDYQEFNYQAAIDMLDNVGSGLSARLASEVSDLKCDFIAINGEADVQEFSENGYEVAGLEQPIDISDDDEA